MGESEVRFRHPAGSAWTDRDDAALAALAAWAAGARELVPCAACRCLIVAGTPCVWCSTSGRVS